MMFRKSPIQELTPAELQERLLRNEIILVDLREAQEFLVETLPGARLYPLSSFNPRKLPVEDGRPIVFHCATGKRSAVAVARCIAAGVPVTMHLKGRADSLEGGGSADRGRCPAERHAGGRLRSALLRSVQCVFPC